MVLSLARSQVLPNLTRSLHSTAPQGVVKAAVSVKKFAPFFFRFETY